MRPHAISGESEEQYVQTDKLRARISLHAKFGRPDWYPWLLSQMDLKPGAIVADVGCGIGSLWAAVSGRLPPSIVLHLVDRSPAMVAAATAQLEGLKEVGVRGIVADACALPFEEAMFDTSIAIHMLYHLPDPEQGVRELRRTMKPGGRALAALNGDGNMREIAELIASVLGRSDRDPSTEKFSVEQGEQAFGRHFTHVAVARFEDELVCDDPVDVYAYVASLPLPPGAGDRMGDMRRAIDRAFAAGGGVFRIRKDMRLLVGSVSP